MKQDVESFGGAGSSSNMSKNRSPKTSSSNNNCFNEVEGEVVLTSTPIAGSNAGHRRSSSCSSSFTTTSSDMGSFPRTPDYEHAAPLLGTMTDPLGEQEYRVPILGYEVMEERARFTVFKLQIQHQSTSDHWHVYRRYTDFIRLNRKLRIMFPGLRFSLPPKRWFGDNFDSSFLEDRVLGLQVYVNNLMLHKNIYQSAAVREFFCLDEPPGANDSLEESKARCESLEEAVYTLRHDLREKNNEVDLLKAELALVKAQLSTLVKSLKLECSLTTLNNVSKTPASLRKLHSFNVTLLNIMETLKEHDNLRSISLGDLPSFAACDPVASSRKITKSLYSAFAELKNGMDEADSSGTTSSSSPVDSPDSETGEALIETAVDAVAAAEMNDHVE